MSLGPIGKVTKVLIGSAAVSLSITLLTAAFTTYGIVDVPLARILLCFAGVVLIAGITTSDYLYDKSLNHIFVVGLLSTAIIGGSLFWLDGWAIRKRAEIDARVLPPPLPKAVTKPPVPPAIAFVKTPKRTPKPLPSNIVLGNQNVTGNEIKNSQVCPGGICAGGDITGSPSITNIVTPHGRALPEEKMKSLVVQLKQTEKISVAIVIFEPITNEMEQLGGQLQEIFRESGWGEIPAYKQDIRNTHITMLSGNLDHPDKKINESEGLHCIGDPEKSSNLTTMLSKAGLTCTMSPEDLYLVPTPKPMLTIFIGKDLSQ